MVSFNYQAKEVAIKIVYYGPGLCGKTTTLQHVFDTLPDDTKGKMLSLATETDRTLFFDFLPIQLGKLKGLDTKIQLYTVPGQVFYNQTRKLVLKGVDGIVFVADSQKGMLETNKESFQNLIANLKSLGMDIRNIPLVMQYNKRDLPNLIDVETLNKELNIYNVPYFETSAITGEGVIETLRQIVRLTLNKITEKYNVEIEYMTEEDEEKEPKKEIKQSRKEFKKGDREENGMVDNEENHQLDIGHEEISAEDLAEMDTDIDFSVDFDDRIIGEENNDSGISSFSSGEEDLGEVDDVEELEDLEELAEIEQLEDLEEEEVVAGEEDVDTEELPQVETEEDDRSQFRTQKIETKVIEERLDETQEIEVGGIEIEAPRVIKAANGYFIPVTIKLPEYMVDELRLNFDLKIEIKRKKKG